MGKTIPEIYPLVAGIQGLDIYNDGSPNSVLRVQYYGRGMWQAPVNTQRKLLAANFGSDITGVCVGNAVHFSDSTYNNPTSWSWSFPGGTPPTSASQTPTVVYSSPGIYPVTLVASNSFSSDTKVKQVYINVYTIDTMPVSEGFEGGTFPPERMDQL
jgi:PKD repeat protein